MRQDLLFYNKGDMYSVVEGRRSEIKSKVEVIPKNTLLNASEEDLVAALTEDLRLDVPVLSEEHALETAETEVDVSGDPMRGLYDRSVPFYVPGTAFTISIPFTGEPAFFHIRPSTFSLNPPRAEVANGELRLTYTRTDPDTASIKASYDADVKAIKEHLRFLASAAEQFHRELPGQVRSAIQARKQRVLAADGVAASIGLPLKRRADAPNTYSVPVRRQTPRIEQIRVPNQAFQPEPALAFEEYEEILRIMSNMVHVMERSPTKFVGMDEESLRDHFLVKLNGQYEGQATGETFNVSGKTDILIRANDRNVFIAECKFWKGAKKLTEAIDQLLSYLSWRDTKTALVIFNRNAGLSDVLATIQQAVPTHPRYKRTVGQLSETSFRYIFGQPGDPNREIILTVLVFDVPTQKTVESKQA
jgi:hypothetical protein